MILYQGLLASTASWARVGRGYLGELLARGRSVAAVSPRGFRHDPSFPLPPGLSILTPAQAHLVDPAVGLGFLHPPRLERLIGRFRANLFVWESDRIPVDWGAALARGAQLVLVPSEFTARAVTAGGVPDEQVRVCPYGVTSDWFDLTRPSPDGPFTFLTIAAPHWRKGLREIFLAYRAAFSRPDDVRLVVKTTYDPGASRRRFEFEIPSWAELRRDCGLDGPDAPAVEIVVDECTDSELPAVLGPAHVYVGTSWGESFGLAVLEAMAAARPVLTTDWGAVCELTLPGPDRIPGHLGPANEVLYSPAPGAQVAIPDVDALAARLRWHAEHPDASRALGEEARKLAETHTWSRATEKLLAVLPA